MEQQFTACTGQRIEEVQQRFKQWRAERKRGAPIPALCANVNETLPPPGI